MGDLLRRVNAVEYRHKLNMISTIIYYSAMNGVHLPITKSSDALYGVYT